MNRGQIKAIILLIFLFFLVTLPIERIFAAPSVSSVSGAFNHKNTITITGSGFGTKATAAPVVWDDASTGTLLTDNGKWSGAWPNRGSDLSYITQYHTPMRGIALPHSHITRYIAGAHGLANEGYDAGYNVMFWKTVNLTSYPFTFYVSWYQIVDPAAAPLRSDWNLKTFDWSSGGAPYAMSSCTNNNWYLGYAPTGTPLTTSTGGAQHGLNDDSWGYSGCGGSLQNPDINGHSANWWTSGKNPLNFWMKMEMEVRITNQSTGYIKVWEDGAIKVNYAGRTDAWTLGTRSIGVGGYSRDYGPNHWRYFADAYLDYTRQRVVLANNASLANATIREVQIPTAWTDNSITLTSNLGQFQSGQTAYLYVVDANGDPNPTGYPVTIGGGGGGTTYTVTPSAGTNGTISPNAPQTVNSGSTTTFIITPNSGYSASVGGTCGGNLVGTTYTTNAITANCTVVASFTASGDTTPPTSPTNLTANATSPSSITVSWTASTDNVGVTGYLVERCQGTGCTNFTQVATPVASPFVDSGLTANTFYNYHVRARDAANNLSGWSNVVGATTQSGTTAPTFTLSANPTSITSGQSSTLTWSAVTNATSCTATGGAFTGSKATSGGTQSVSPTSTTTYTLSCTGAGGMTNRSATVAVGGGGGGVSMNECSSMQNDWIFCDDFDTGVATDAERRARWDDGDGGLDVNFPVNTGPSQQGTNHVAQLRAPQGERGGADLIQYSLPGESYDKLYARYYIQYEPGFNFDAPNHGGGLMGGNSAYYWRDGIRPNGSDVFTALMEHRSSAPFTPYLYTYYAGMYQDCSNPNGACWGDSFPCTNGSGYCTKPQHLPTGTLPNIQTGRWYCAETMLDAGTPTPSASGANGGMQLWFDEQSLGSWNDLWFRNTATLKINAFEIALFHHDGTHSTEGILYDNIVLSTSRIGCGNVSSDTTPPTSPTNLAANATSPSSITVTWTASTDNVGVTGYIVERCQGSGCTNFTQVGTPSASPFVDTGLTANTFYNYHVRARDAANNLSGWSNVVGATTQAIAPVTELIIDNTDTATSQSGSWSPSTNFPGYYGTNYHYSPNQSGEWFEWHAANLSPGTYEVYAYWNANAGRPTDVSYLITHSGGTATRNNINQTQNGSQWNLLGTYTFGATGTVRVQSGGTGTEGTVADAVRFLKTTTAPCNTINTTNFSQSAYNSYGAPFDAFQTSTNLMNATCTSTDTHTINLTTGVTGDTTRIVYTKGYYYDPVTAGWTQYSGTCTGALNGEWCQGSISATITNPNISTASASNPAYLVGMTCSVQGGSWKCGCRDTSCTNFSWQIQGAGL